jgi:hypothetical protein
MLFCRHYFSPLNTFIGGSSLNTFIGGSPLNTFIGGSPLNTFIGGSPLNTFIGKMEGSGDGSGNRSAPLTY